MSDFIPLCAQKRTCRHPVVVSQDANKKPALCPSSTGGKVVFRSMIELGQNRGGDVEPI